MTLADPPPSMEFSIFFLNPSLIEGVGETNQLGIAYYRNLIDALGKKKFCNTQPIIINAFFSSNIFLISS